MPRIYEVPTHLNVEDTLLLGLTARQLVRLAAFASLAYGLWDQVTAIPPVPRAVAAGRSASGLSPGWPTRSRHAASPGGGPTQRQPPGAWRMGPAGSSSRRRSAGARTGPPRHPLDGIDG
jgi:hypothetical protein